MQLERLSR